MAVIKTLVVGYGLSAKAFHLPFLLNDPAYKVIGIVQPRGSSAKQDFPQLQHYRSLEEALAERGATLVVITAPNEFHAPMARTALLDGRHVVVEKPFAVDVAGGEMLAQLAKEQGKVLSIYHNRRWDADFLTLKEVITENRVGQPVMFSARFDRFRPHIRQGWKEEQGPGTGIFYDLGPHLIDQALQLFGWPEFLYAHMRIERPDALTTDAFDLYLYYEKLTVHLSAGSLVSIVAPRFTLLGTKGGYTKWGMDPQEAALRQGIKPVQQNWGMEAESAWGTLVQLSENGETESTPYPSHAGNYGTYYHKLAAAIRQEGENPVKPEEALQVMKIIEQALRSNREGKKITLQQS